MKSKFTDEYLFNSLKEIYKNKKEPLNFTILKEERNKNKNFPSTKAFSKRFGSIENACKLANVPYCKKKIEKFTKLNKVNLREGKTFYNSKGEKFKIVKYNNANDIYVEFENNIGHLHHTSWRNIENGIVKDIYARNIFNVACVGNSVTKINGVKKESYKVWYAMLQRCYNECYKTKPTYKDCYVCDEWLCYENFEKWYDKNYYKVNEEVMNLDKDILIKENKIYSPKTCCFVPRRLNILFVNTNNKNTIKRITDLYKDLIPKYIIDAIYNNYIL